jgi:hypothetical protein
MIYRPILRQRTFLMKNVIPPMTHELSRYWEQPLAAEILVDDVHALMTRATFDKLAEYSASNPTGAYEGKMWKRLDGEFDEEFKAHGGVPEWLLCWFGESQIGPGYVSNNHRKILLLD